MLTNRRSRKPYHLLSAVHRRRLEKLERAARNEYECLQQQNLDAANAGADSDFVDEGQILAECSQAEEDEISVSSDASVNDVQFAFNEVDEVLSSSDDAESISDYDDAVDIEPRDTIDNFQERLAEVFVRSDMSHSQINAVLQVVRTHPCLSTLPKDSRTLLKTPRTAHPTLNIAGGEYLHLGFETGILSILQQTSPELIPLDSLMVDFSTDGATLDGQGKIQMWPIQIRIANIRRSKPEIVSVWRASSKPSNAHELFKYFVDEVQDVLNRGVVFQLKVIELRCFIADSLTRAFVLGHKSHGSIFPCSKCWIRGNWLRRGVVAYRGIQHRLRTDEEYRQCIDGEHHTDSDSPLLTLKIGLVTQTVFDLMHTIFLGVVPKINSVFVEGKYNLNQLAVKEFCRIEDFFDVGLLSSSMSQRGRGRGRGADKTCKALQLLSTDIAKYRTSHSQLQRRNMTTPTVQRQTASLHAPSSSFSPTQSYEYIPPSSTPLQHRCISSHSPSTAAQSFARNIPSTSKLLLQRKQTSSHSPSPATESFSQNIHPSSKLPSQRKQTLSRPPPSSGQRLSLVKHEEEWTKNKETSYDIMQSLKIIMAQLRRIEERQISIENKIDENARAISKLIRESTVKRPVKPQGISFRTVDDFLAFEEVDEETYKDLIRIFSKYIGWTSNSVHLEYLCYFQRYENIVGYFVYLGRANPVDCAAEYFRSVFPEDEEVSLYITLNGRTGPGGCKLRDSRFAQACQDAINSNKHFPNNSEFYEALEKALKSLKTRKWRCNKKRRQTPLQEDEKFPPNRRRRIDNPEEDIDSKEEAEDANELEEIQHTEEPGNADEMESIQDADGAEDNDVEDTDNTEYRDEIEDDLLEEQENLKDDK